MINYFKNTFKSFGLLRMIVSLIVFIGFIYMGRELTVSKLDVSLFSFITTETFSSLTFYVPLMFFIIIAFIELFRLKKEKIEVFDFLIVFSIISTIGIYLIDFKHNSFSLLSTISCGCLLLVLLGEFVARFLAKPSFEYSRSKALYHSMFKPSILFTSLIGGLIAVLLSTFFKNNTLDTIYLGYIALGLVGYFVLYTIFNIFYKNKSILDDLTILLFAFVIGFYCANINTMSLQNEMLVGFGLIILYLSLEGKILLAKDNSKVSNPNYFKELGNKYDHIYSYFITLLIIVALVVETRLEITGHILNWNIEGISYLTIGILAVSLILLILMFIKFNFNSKKIITNDYILYTLSFIGMILLLFTLNDLYLNDFNFNLFVTNDYILYSASVVISIVSLICLVIRINKFNKNQILVDNGQITDEIDFSNEIREVYDDSISSRFDEDVEHEMNQNINNEELDEEIEEALNQIPEKEEIDSEIEEALNQIPEKEEIDNEIEEALNQIPEKENNTVVTDDSQDELGFDEDEEENEEDDESDEEEDLTTKINTASNVEIKEITTLDSEGNKKVIKRKFISKLMFAPYESKYFYSEVKNYFMLYKAKGRSSSSCETFRNKGLISKVTIMGSTIKVYLALDPKEFVDTKYRFVDVSDKRKYKDVPFLIKVKSERSLKQFKELVDLMMEKREIKAKKKYEAIDFTTQLIPNGEAILTSIGYSSDYILDSVNVRSVPSDLPDDLENYIPIVQGEELNIDETPVSMYLDTLCAHFEDNGEVSLDILKSLGLVANGSVLKIKARGTLDKKLIIYADEFEPLALKMMMAANCTAVKIIR